MGGYGCMPDYERALNWFERSAGMGDYRISEKAADAAKELRGLIQKAEDENNAVLDRYAQMGEEQQSRKIGDQLIYDWLYYVLYYQCR